MICYTEDLNILSLCFSLIFDQSGVSLLFSSIEGVPRIKSQVTSDELLNSPSNFLVYVCKSKGEFDVRSGVT